MTQLGLLRLASFGLCLIKVFNIWHGGRPQKLRFAIEQYWSSNVE